MWPGRLSNSELLLRHNLTFAKNPVGVGDNTTAPHQWNPDGLGQANREYAKFNCTYPESFELRFSAKGYPQRQLARCARLSWFMENG